MVFMGDVMLFVFGKLLLIIAVSLDSFGVGVSYGLRRIHVPKIGLLIIMLCSGTMVLMSMSIGVFLTTYISFEIIEIFGGTILISIGCISFFSAKPTGKSKKNLQKNFISNKINQQMQRNRYLNNIKLIFSVLKNSQEADVDKSGSISVKEGFLLGVVLGLDAFGAGFGAALVGYSPLLTSILIAVISASFLFLGIKSGLFISKFSWSSKMKLIPSFLLIGIGIFYIL